MTELSALGLKADSSGLVKATTDLKHLAEQAGATERAADGLARGTDRAKSSQDKLAPAARRSGHETARLGREARTTQGALARMAASISTGVNGALTRMASLAGSALGRLTAMAAAFFTLRAGMQAVDGWSDMQSRLGAAIGDMEAAPAMMQRMVDIANASYSPLAQTVEVYARNVAVLRDLGKTAVEAAQFTEALNHALVITATKGQDAEVVQNALSRSIATGTMRAMEYETIMSRSPRVLQAIAEEVGTTLTGLRALAAEGKITGEVIASALVNSLQDLSAEAAEMPATIGDAFVRIGTNLTALIGRFDQAFAASESVAGWLVSLADRIGELAQTDFVAWATSAGDALTLLSQIVLVLASTRIPMMTASLYATATAFWAANAGAITARFTFALMITQMYAGAAAARGLSGALSLVAASMRGIMFLAGGPFGLAAAAITAAYIVMSRARGEHATFKDAVEGSANAQRGLNEALLEFQRVQSLQTALEWQRQAQAAVDEARRGIEALGGASFWASFRDSIDPSVALFGREGRVSELSAEAVELRDRFAEAEAQLAEADAAVQRFGESGVAATQAVSAAAAEASADLIRGYERRAELATLELLHGRQSAAYVEAQLRHTREDVSARLEAAQATQEIVDATLAALDAASLAERATSQWRDMTEEMRQKVQEVHRELRSMANVDVGESFMSRGIARLARMAQLAVEAAAGIDAVSRAEALGLDDAGNPLAPGIRRGMRPSARPVDFLPGDDRTSSRGRSQAASEAERQAKAIQEVVKSLEDEIRLIGASETARRTHQALQQAGVEIYSEEGQRIAGLVEELVHLEDQHRRVEEATKAGVGALSDLFMTIGQGSDAARQALMRLLSEIARIQMVRALDGLGKGDGTIGAIIRGIGGMLTQNAAGGVYSSPSLSAYSGEVHDSPKLFAFAQGGVPGQRAGVFGEAGPEAIMPLKRGRDGKLGVFASGGSQGGTKVEVNNYSGQEARTETTRGPNGEEVIRVIVGKQIAQGKHSKAMGNRYGLKDRTVAR